MQIPACFRSSRVLRGILAKRIGPIHDDTIGYALQRQSPNRCRLSCEIRPRLKRNGVLRSNWSRGWVGAVDGIEICRSFVRCCDACMDGKSSTSEREMRTIFSTITGSRGSACQHAFPQSPWVFAFRRTRRGVGCALALPPRSRPSISRIPDV